MGNPNYIKGRKKEYKICRELRLKGYDIVQRTAGSHSPIDIIAIHRNYNFILFVQSKPDDMKPDKIEKEMEWLQGMFKVRFEVR